MKCPDCKHEVARPCWEGPTHKCKGVDCYVCGKIPEHEIRGVSIDAIFVDEFGSFKEDKELKEQES